MAGLNQRQTGYSESPQTFESAVTCSSALSVGRTLNASSALNAAGAATLSGGVYEAIQTVATTSGTLTAYGISILSNTSQMAVILPAPVAGVQKAIFNIAATTKAHTVTTAATSQTLDSTGTILTFDAVNQFVRLVGASSTRWLVVSTTGTHSGIS